MRRLTLTTQFGILSAALVVVVGLVFHAGVYVAIALAVLYLAQLAFVASASHKLRIQVEENEYQALHDTLTRLPNRTLFRDRMEQAILQARREDSRFSLLIMDLDRFKEINDTLGHRNGDLILQAIGPRLRSLLATSTRSPASAATSSLCFCPARRARTRRCAWPARSRRRYRGRSC